METSPLTSKALERELPKYTPEETIYHGAVLARLVKAKIERDTPIAEFNNKTFIDNYRENERLANTYIERKSLDKDIVIASGTVEQKLFTVAAEINRLNLSPEVRVYDRENNEYQKLAVALTDAILKTEELEGDEENKLLRQVELLKQGHVFIQDNWVKEYKKEKSLNQQFTGQVKGIDWETKISKVFEGPRRSILFGPGVYLGNIREFNIKKQPFIFTVKTTSYDEAKSRYGGTDKDGKNLWERWEFVPKKRVQVIDDVSNISSFNIANGWTMSSMEDDMVEEIHYQDSFNNEYQIYLNGIPMLPVAFPLSAITPKGDFNITMQVLQAVNPFFAYGRSFVARTREQSDLLDEMLRLLILKTRKSIHPPYANISGKVISAKSLMPGAITMNLDPGALVPIGQEGEGATSSEYQMLKQLQDNIDKITVSPQFQGQQGKSGTTAYEVDVLRKQAEKVLSLIVFAETMLEKKVSHLRLDLVMWKYFDPIDTRLDEVKNEIRNVFRKTSRKTDIEGRGSGIRKVIPTDDDVLPSSEEIADMEDFHETPEAPEGHRRKSREQLGLEPVEMIYLSVQELRNANLIFFIEIDAKEKDTSNNAKLMFREELRDVQALMNMGSVPNVQELENTYASIWKRRKEKLFAEPRDMSAEEIPGGGADVLSQSGPGMTNMLAGA